jgi:hypothetical protein
MDCPGLDGPGLDWAAALTPVAVSVWVTDVAAPQIKIPANRKTRRHSQLSITGALLASNFAPAMRRKDFFTKPVIRSNGILYRWSSLFLGYKNIGSLQKSLNPPTCTVAIDMDPPAPPLGVANVQDCVHGIAVSEEVGWQNLSHAVVPPLGAA